MLFENHSYYYKVQCELFISERSYCDFVFLWKNNEMYIERIVPDKEFWEAVSNKAKIFHNKFHLLSLTPWLKL